MTRERRKSTTIRTELAARRSMRWLDTLDARLFGSRLRRGLDYVDRAQDQPKRTSLRPMVQPIAEKIWLEQRLPAAAFLTTCALPRFVGGVTGRVGTGWLIHSIGRHLPPAYNVITEIGLFNYAQFRKAPYEYYYYATRTRDGRRRYMEFWRRFMMDWAYDSKRALENGPRGLRDLVPRRAVRIALEELEARLENTQDLSGVCVAFGDFYTWLFNFHAVVSSGEPLWVSKEPAYGRHADDLFRMMPRAKLVVLTRDGRDVALSMVERGWHPLLRQAIDRWREFALMTLEALDKVDADRYLLVRYEDMVVDYDAEICRIMAFLELPLLSGGAMTDRIRPDAASVRRWKREMSQTDVQYFLESCSSIMERLGYSG